MKAQTKGSIYFLENTDGVVVRAINWSSETLHFIQRLDTNRIENTENLSFYDKNEIPYKVLDSVKKSEFSTKKALKIKATHLKLVQENDHEVLASVPHQEDDEKRFFKMLKNTATGAAGLVVILFIFSFFVGKMKPEEKLQLVEVVDRKEIMKKIEEKVVVAPAPKAPKTKVTKVYPKTVKKVVKNAKPTPSFNQRGALGILGSLKSSKQQGGLNLDNVGSSRGIGRGGNQGSGGVQKTVYAKGLFSAPLGSGNNAQGAGGYGTKGKGGGQAGYGNMNLIGSSKVYLEPVGGEAWVDGGLDPNEISAVIQRHISEVRACYEQGLQKTPHLSGRVSMKFFINAAGRVSTASVNNSSLNQVAVENCIEGRLKSWKFPKPEGGVTVKVSYPFVLRRVSAL